MSRWPEEAMSHAERIGRVLRGESPDRMPYFLNAALHGPALIGTSIREAFGDPELAVESALAVQARLGNDLVTSFVHAAGEVEAFGGEVIFYDDGPPNAGRPPLDAARIDALAPPPLDHPALALRLEVTRGLVARVGGRIPVVGALVAPFSLPVMQLGFPAWLDLLQDEPRRARALLEVNVAHCLAFGRAQLAAGAAALLVFDPLGSTSITARALYDAFGLPTLRRLLAEVGGGAAVSTASAPVQSRVHDFVSAGAAMVVAAEDDDLAAVARATEGRAVALGNLNGLRMRSWSAAEATRAIEALVAQIPPDARVIVAEHHGEIPLQVPLETLDAVAAALRSRGARGG